MRNLSVVILLLLSLYVNAGTSGKTVFSDSAVNTYKVAYARHLPQDYGVSNLFIKEIARFSLQDISETNYTLTYKQKYRVLELDSTHFKAVVEFEDLECSGDVSYRSFDISDAVLPSRTDFELWILKGGDTFKRYEVKNVNLDKSGPVVAQVNFMDNAGLNDFSVRIRNIDFYNDSSDLSVFDAKINHINRYYAFDNLLALQTIHLNSLSTQHNPLAEQLVAWYMAHRFKNLVGKENLEEKLDLAYYDPAGYQQNLKDFNIEFYRIRKNIDYLNDNNNFGKTGFADQFAEYFHDQILELQHLWTTAGYYNSSAFSALLNTGHSAGELDELKNLLFQSAQAITTKDKAGELTAQVINEAVTRLLSGAERLIGEHNYNDALGLLINAKSLNTISEDQEQKKLIKRNLAKVKYGIFYSYLKVAARALTAENLEMTANYISKASDFQESNESFIISDVQVQEKYAEMVDLCLTKGKKFNQEENYNQAVEYLRFADIFANQLAQPSRQQMAALDYQLKTSRQGVYDQLLRESEQQFNYFHTKAARQKFDAAVKYRERWTVVKKNHDKELELNYKIEYELFQSKLDNIEILFLNGEDDQAFEAMMAAIDQFPENLPSQNPRLDKLIKAIIPEKINYLLEIGNRYLDEQKNASAIAILERAEAIVKKFVSSEIVADLSESELAIEKLSCRIQLYQYNQNVTKAGQYFYEGKFLMADHYLKTAKGMVESKDFCAINDSALMRLNALFSPTIKYVRLIGESEMQLGKGDYSGFVIEFEQADKWYFVNRDQIRIKKIEIYDYLREQSDNEQIVKSLNYLLENARFRKALLLINKLHETGFSANQTRNLQKAIGNRVAKARSENLLDTVEFDEIKEMIKTDREYRFAERALESSVETNGAE